MKKTALGLTLLLSMSTAIACAPADDGTMNDPTANRGAGYQQQDNQFGNRGLGTNNRQGLLDQNNRGNQFDVQNQRQRGSGMLGQNQGQRGTGFEGQNQQRGPGMTAPRGFLDRGQGQQGQQGMNQNQQLAQTIEQRCQAMDEVDNARVLVYEDDIIIGLQNNGDNDDVDEQIKEQLGEEIRGKDIHVTDDEQMFERIGDLEQQVNNGQPMQNLGNEMGQLLDDIGRTITSPIRNQ